MQVGSGMGAYVGAARRRVLCDGNPSDSVWPSPRQTRGPSCSYLSDCQIGVPRRNHGAYAGGPSAWSSPPDPDKTRAMPSSSIRTCRRKFAYFVVESRHTTIFHRKLDTRPHNSTHFYPGHQTSLYDKSRGVNAVMQYMATGNVSLY